MKNTSNPLAKFIYLMLLVFVLLNCDGEKSEETEKKEEFVELQKTASDPSSQKAMMTGTVDIVDLSSVPVPTLTAETEFKRLTYCVRLKTPSGSTISINHIINTIENTELDKLKQFAKYEIDASCDTNYVLALRLTFGVESNSVIIFYEPVGLCLNNYTVELGKTYGVYNVMPYGTSYKYESNQFQPVMSTTAIASYTAMVEIDHDCSGIFEAFNPEYTEFGDVRSLIFSFSEIEGLMSDNGATSFKIFNSAIKYPTSTHDTIVKHTVLLGPPSFNFAFLKSNKVKAYYLSAGTYYNRSNLCPPECNQITLKLLK